MPTIEAAAMISVEWQTLYPIGDTKPILRIAIIGNINVD